ncbi:hypothetical protein [Ferroacidibacillus organovorans]|uniref:Uncharacterized protein n=1 Tax=Ferroacidibacillus organovorans TaxID=1765683 RepID=A0A101XP21_9BACL|nr:hypothetical protein [Ferroacidibacillus organovorans]KUO94948.1 hypothetical protein ATW55_04755 [Ferroacidibacillus organovorans]
MIPTLLFILTVIGIGLLLDPFFAHMNRLERLGLAILCGSVLLPFLLFFANAYLLILPLAKTGAGVFFRGGVTVLALASLVWFLLREIHALWAPARSRRAPRQKTKVRISALLSAASLLAFAAFVIIGIHTRLFGWDEYSYWMYAAKVLTVTGGNVHALLANAYGSYPPGFPELVAWNNVLQGDISIQHAKWIAPFYFLGALTVEWGLFKRYRLTTNRILILLALTVWGCQSYDLFTILAYGEMPYVDLYTPGVIYLAFAVRTKDSRDLNTGVILLLFSAFLRVDGWMVAGFTLAVFFLFSARQTRSALREKKRLLIYVSAALPILLWNFYLFHHPTLAGWGTRLTLSRVSARLPWPFMSHVLGAMWTTVTNLRVYPIVAAYPFLVWAAFASRSRALWFLLAVVFAQFAYLFTAYMTVFSSFEALHASSLDRYLLRIDPLISAGLYFALYDEKPAKALATMSQARHQAR